MKTLKILLFAGLCLALGQPSSASDSSLINTKVDDWYGQNLDRLLRENEDWRKIPNSSVRSLARRYDRTELQVVADLKRQQRRGREVMTPLNEVVDKRPVMIPDSSWDQQPYLTPEYERRLDGVITKYGGVAFVPQASIVWLARKWNTTPDQVKHDLQRVQRHDPDTMVLRGFAH